MGGRTIRDLIAGTRGRLGAVVTVGVVVAAAVVFLPGLLSPHSGAKPHTTPTTPVRLATERPAAPRGAIVVQKTRMVVITRISTRRRTHQALTLTSITEGAGGGVQRSLLMESVARPGFQEAYAGDTLELYDPLDNTIYEATEAGLDSAEHAARARRLKRAAKRAAPKGARVLQGTGVGQFQTIAGGPDPSTAPDGSSVFRLDLREHLYRILRRTHVNGQRAIELVATRKAMREQEDSDSTPVLGTVYVNPVTYAPIRQVIDARLVPDIEITSIQDWLKYQILPLTAANERLLSLSARHPGAHVVHGAVAFLRARDAGMKPRARTQATS